MATTTNSILGHLWAAPRDGVAWDRFMLRFGPYIRARASRSLPRSEVEDVVSEVYLAFLKALTSPTQAPPENLRGWLATVIRNKTADCLGARARRGGDRDVHELPNEPPDPAAERELEQAAYREVLDYSMDRVREESDPLEWEVFIRHRVNGDTARDVASALTTSERPLSDSNVRQIAHRIGEAIQKKMS